MGRSASRGRRIWVSTLVCALVALPALGASASAADPGEPNDSIVSASGPLLLGQTIEGSLDPSSDRDFYYFYITSPEAQLSLTVKNLGGSASAASLNASVLDTSASVVDAFAYYLAPGSQATSTKTLPAQKYLLEVAPAAAGAGPTSYSITAGGSGGAFGPYPQVADRCAKASARRRSIRTALNRSQGRMQRAIAQLRQSAYGTAGERSAARVKFRKVRAEVRDGHRKLRAANRRLEPWCSIPQ